ncbi:P-loop containing nucleoside triphosphate hydrolase protein [Immersiella caudata]|uniref:P-loop containing nucleoside triphosphate hydrolase protein n=1 Tax=Immersiella caudata TaxID=314043 RepID=A0AA40C067_9PEZI|nr:P-loop containing nucleoside triphosphate hydrolase protein [Immersiella caudata]
MVWDGVLCDRPGGLDTGITGTSLSKGQQQLLALARVLVLKEGKKVVLLDEVTGNVDVDTDATVQQVVREQFDGYTVIVVAHRLDTIMGSDVIVVMKNGGIVEVGSLKELLSNDGGQGALAKMVKG